MSQATSQYGYSNLQSFSLYRLSLVGMILVCNTVMMNFFARGMNFANSRDATILSASANLLSTVALRLLSFKGIMGALIFGESLSLQWIVGALSIIGGCFLLNTAAPEKPVHKDKRT